MACFDVFPNPGVHNTSTPYLLDVQSELFDGLDSRMVVPLRSMAHFPTVKLPTRLTPVLTVAGADYLRETPKMGAVPQRVLKNSVASMAE